ncbi:LRRC45, partial [Symbiodinium sp. CCMP2456]
MRGTICLHLPCLSSPQPFSCFRPALCLCSLRPIMADRASRNSASAEGSARGSDGYPGFPPRPAADATGALLLPAALDLRDLEDLTDAELTTILRRCSVAFLTRLARLCVRIVRAEPEVIYCQEPCNNPDCNQACGRRIDPIPAGGVTPAMRAASATALAGEPGPSPTSPLLRPGPFRPAVDAWYCCLGQKGSDRVCRWLACSRPFLLRLLCRSHLLLQAHFVDCLWILWTSAEMSSAPPAFDDPLALSALLAKWTAPDTLHPLLVAKGFRTIASIAYAIPGDGSPDDFLRVLWPPSDPDNPPTLVTPEASFARRLLVQSRALVHPPASSAGPAAAAIPSAPPPKITAENAETLRAKFIDSYPGELLSPASTPSVEFLNRLRAELDKPTTLWVPWRLRTSEHDLQMFYENRRPRSDGQLLRHLLDGVPEPVTAQAPAHTSGPVEPALRRHLGLLITALAFLGDLHLKLGKAYAESFIAAATATPLDSSLRPPSMQEVLAADKAVWGAIAGLMRDEKFSLADALQEITVTRHMILTVLCPRPRSMPAPPVRDSNPRSGANAASDRADILTEKKYAGGSCLAGASCPSAGSPIRAAAPLSMALSELGCDRIAPVDALFGEQIDVLDPVHQAYLGTRPTWIGWCISLNSFTAAMEPSKQARLRSLLRSALDLDSLPLALLRKLTGKLLWVCSLFRAFRPSLAPLYKDQSLPPLVHVALGPEK